MLVSSFFRAHPVFRRAELVDYLDKHGGSTNDSSVNSLLAHHGESGRLVKVRRSLYAVVPQGLESERYHVDRFLVGSRAWSDGVLGYHTALELHGYAHSSFERVFVICPEPRRGFEFGGTEFVPCAQPRSLLDEGEGAFGVIQQDRQGLDIKVTTIERTIVDCLTRASRAGGWEEIARSIDGVPYVDLEELISYVELLDNGTTAAKVGFLLESKSKEWFVEEADIRRLAALAPSNPRYADQNRPSSFVSRWNLMVPDELIHQWGHVA